MQELLDDLLKLALSAGVLLMAIGLVLTNRKLRHLERQLHGGRH